MYMVILGEYIKQMLHMRECSHLLTIRVIWLRGAGMMNYKNIDRISLYILYRPWKATVV